MSQSDALKRTAELINSGKATKIAVLTGAGISTSAGIPDFRSPGTGLYDNLAALNLPFPEAVFTLDYFEQRPEPFWTLARDLYPGKYFPTPTHYFLALLHQKGVLQRVWSQNIDTLETAAGVPVDLVLEAHGSFATAHCLDCKRNASVEHVVKSGVRHGRVVHCMHESCNGLVKPDIVFFGEGLPHEFFHKKRELLDCDLMIILGTSLAVQPFASLVDVIDRTTPRLLINREAVGPFAGRRLFGRKRDMVFLGDADDAVRQLARELGWEDELDELIASGKEELKEKWARQEKLWTPDNAEKSNKDATQTTSDSAERDDNKDSVTLPKDDKNGDDQRAKPTSNADSEKKAVTPSSGMKSTKDTEGPDGSPDDAVDNLAREVGKVTIGSKAKV